MENFPSNINSNKEEQANAKQSYGEEGSEKSSRLVDMFTRTISYLRLSVTDHCNLRCLYCSPKDADEKLAHTDLLSYEELYRVVRLAVDLGIGKVRITGGEPLVRRGVIDFISQLTAISGLDDVRLTTNATLLHKYLDQLKEAGIRKINISLDTLRPERYLEITGCDLFSEVCKSIETALAKGFSPLKINVVAMKGINDDELIDFAKLSIDRPLQIRFIEFMPIGRKTAWNKEKCLKVAEIKERIAPLGRLEAVARDSMEGPARIFKLPDAAGSIGFISPVSEHFCDQCNRLRLTSEGKLRSCLLHDTENDLKKLIRNGASDEEIKKLMIKTVLDKPQGHQLMDKNYANCHGSMSRIGG